MQIAAIVIAYDVSKYINAMLRNVAPHVDKIYVAHPKRPWNYIPSSRESRLNPTKLEHIDFTGLEDKVEVLQGDWETEEETRNACFDRAKFEGFDWLIIQDADEFYTEESWHRIRSRLEANPECELFKTTWFNFWKSSEFVLVDSLGSMKSINAGFAVRCRQQFRFERSRSTNTTRVQVLDCPCYHYGYVKSDREMLEKVTQWGHAHQFNGQRWFEIKWRNWNLSTSNIHPVSPTDWKRAIRFPLHQPEFAFQFALPVVADNGVSLKARLRERIYDFRFETFHALRSVKRAFVGAINGSGTQ